MSPAAAQRRYDRIASDLAERAGVKLGKMFGMPSMSAGGKAFAGLFEDSMVFKLKGDQNAAALELSGARLFDPSGRRPMKAWVQVPSTHARTWPSLADQALAQVKAAR